MNGQTTITWAFWSREAVDAERLRCGCGNLRCVSQGFRHCAHSERADSNQFPFRRGVRFPRQGGEFLAFSTSVLAATLTALNSVQPGGIHPSPPQNHWRQWTVSRQEVRFDVTIEPDTGGQFFWLSGSRADHRDGNDALRSGSAGVDSGCRSRSRLASRGNGHRGRLRHPPR